MFINNTIKDYINQFTSKSNSSVFSVYAICKNELKNVDEWLTQFDSCDYICVLDTGSTDGTYERLVEHSKKDSRIIVKQKKYENFHFDEARNDAYDLMPYCTDVCITLDFDERLQKDWFECLNNMYGNALLEKVIHIKRNIYEEGKFDGKFDTRLLSHPYLKDNRVFEWRGYSGENIVYGYEEDLSLSEVSRKFRIYYTIYTTDLYCNHFIEKYSFKTVLKGIDGKRKCIEFFNDIHYKFLKEENIFKMASYLHMRMIDYHSFINIFKLYSNMSDLYINEELVHMLDVINSQKIDIGDISPCVISFMIDGILKQKGIIFRDFMHNCVDDICKALIEHSSNKQLVEESIKIIQSELNEKFMKETDKLKVEEYKPI